MSSSSAAGLSSEERPLYKVLGCEPSATAAQLKKAYHRAALKCHPDKARDDPQAKDKFQELQQVAAVLLDEGARAAYDESGVVPGEDGLGDLSGKSFDELYRYFREQHQAVTEEDLEEWALKYPGSSMEREDLSSFFERYGGDMAHILECIPFAEKHDLWRLKCVLDELIAAGELASTKEYERFAPRQISDAEAGRLKAKRQKAQAKKQKQKKRKKTAAAGGAAPSGGGDADLMAMIQGRQAGRQAGFDGMLDSLAAKYGGGEKKSRKKR